MPEEVHFILNEDSVVESISAGTLVLDFLREKRRLVGTKEGCREGDCGACVVLIGKQTGDRVRYKTVTSCLMPVSELHGTHLVTVEGLSGDKLSPIQEAIVDSGASQCGFCTPGIVMSLTGFLMENSDKDMPDEMKEALGGHLCRCTGYRSLKSVLPSVWKESRDRKSLIDLGFLPSYFADIDQRLRTLTDSIERSGSAERAVDQPSQVDIILAGGTDLYVQKGDAIPVGNVKFLHHLPDLSRIDLLDDGVFVGALTTFEDFATSPKVQSVIPDIRKYMSTIASLPVRNRATVGGNIVNASPIGDVTVLLLALGASLLLESGNTSDANRSKRTIPLSEFYLGYKQLVLRTGEMLTGIIIPRPRTSTRMNWEKVSKREFLDIASVNTAMSIRVENDTIETITISAGGVSPIPLVLTETNDFLSGKRLDRSVVERALDVAQSEITPIDDVRGSATYKRILLRQLVLAHFIELFPETISVEAA